MDPLQPQLDYLTVLKLKKKTLCFFRHPKLDASALRPLAEVLIPTN